MEPKLKKKGSYLIRARKAIRAMKTGKAVSWD